VFSSGAVGCGQIARRRRQPGTGRWAGGCGARRNDTLG